MALTILIVDDSRLVRTVINKSLELADVPTEQVFQAANGVEALGILQENPIDLVFADIHMPVMDGVEMIDRIKADPQLQNIPIVIISSDSSKARANYLLSKGINAFIHKPFTPESIREIVDQVIGIDHAS